MICNKTEQTKFMFMHFSKINIIIIVGECRTLKESISTEQLYNSVVMVVGCILRFKRLFHSDTCPINIVYWKSLALLSLQLNAIQLFSTQSLTNAAQKNLRSVLSLYAYITLYLCSCDSSCLVLGLLLNVISLPFLR